MGFERKEPPPDEQPGAPEWMLTFSDCMTLLLTFFVLLMTFSAPGNSDIAGMSEAFARFLPGFDWANKMYRDSLYKYIQFYPGEPVEAGSEKPTLEQGTKGGLRETTAPPDFDKAKMFSIPSERIFFGQGSVISAEGRVVLATVASFLNKMTNRVIICEYGPKKDKGSEELGLHRSYTVMEYLSTKHRLNRKRFSISISAASLVTERFDRPEHTVEGQNADSGKASQAETDNGRTLEITIMDRSSYN